MPEEKPADAIEKFLLEQKAVEDRKHALIEDLLRQRRRGPGLAREGSRGM